MTKCIHVVNIGNYFPELFRISIVTIEKFAKKIDSDLNVITKRKYNTWPVLTEKLQVYDYGKNYDWNLLLDADILVHPDADDPFENFDPKEVGVKDSYHANQQLMMDESFLRDQRNVGLSSCVVATSKETHDLWKLPDDITKEQILNNILQNRKIVDEYVISRNLAKYRYGYRELFPIEKYDMLYHLGSYAQNKSEMLNRATKWLNPLLERFS